MNLTTHIPADHSWTSHYIDKMGIDALSAYYDKVFLMLLQMPAGSEFCIPNRVQPGNYDLFIKCAVMAINEICHSTKTHKSYFFEQQATVILVR